MKTIIQIVLALIIVLLGYFIYESIMEPVNFNREVAKREAQIVQRLKDIRQVQIAHRSRYGGFVSDLDSLMKFYKTDSLATIRAIGTVPDTLTETEAVRLGIVQRDTFWIQTRDSLLRRARYPIDSLTYVPFTDGVRFVMDAGQIERGLTKLPVFEAYALPKDYLKDLDRWKVYYTRDIEAGLRVGSMFEASTDGNWE
ncbi:MAG: hypothetical protein EA361_02760 [Bacteroidetes bacterium]|nr:MAG: hypothetical protein EA361_02760 [Bacteroidota bacterium]